MTRIYLPATVSMLARLAESGELRPDRPVHMVTAWLRREAPGADVEDLEYTAFDDAALASAGLLAGEAPRRVVISADVPEDRLAERGDSTEADFDGSVKLKKVAAIHVDDVDAATLIAKAFETGQSLDASALDEHVLDWYAPSELQDLLAALALGALGISRPKARTAQNAPANMAVIEPLYCHWKLSARNAESSGETDPSRPVLRRISTPIWAITVEASQIPPGIAPATRWPRSFTPAFFLRR
jgi:hypothetical protein